MRRFSDSPMLEHAQERQFAISQLGTRSMGFQVQHTHRIEAALDWIQKCFSMHELDEARRPVSPHIEDLADFRSLSPRHQSLPPLEALDETELTPEPPSLTTTSSETSRSPMALRELMNPEPIEPSRNKRKFSDSLMYPVLPDDSSDGQYDLLDSSAFHSTIIYIRAGSRMGEGTSRTHRRVRLRRSRSQVQADLRRNGCEPNPC